MLGTYHILKVAALITFVESFQHMVFDLHAIRKNRKLKEKLFPSLKYLLQSYKLSLLLPGPFSTQQPFFRFPFWNKPLKWMLVSRECHWISAEVWVFIARAWLHKVLSLKNRLKNERNKTRNFSTHFEPISTVYSSYLFLCIEMPSGWLSAAKSCSHS